MTVELEDIRAWVDGELDEPRASTVGNAVLSDQTLTHTALKLRASLLPYRLAYENTPLVKVPSSLRARLKALRESDV